MDADGTGGYEMTRIGRFKQVCKGAAISTALWLPMVWLAGWTFWRWLMITGIVWMLLIAGAYVAGVWRGEDD